MIADGSATDCTHFIGADGTLVFDNEEVQKDILVPIINDTSGARVFFTVELSDVIGPGELGAFSTATVYIENVAGGLDACGRGGYTNLTTNCHGTGQN